MVGSAPPEKNIVAAIGNFDGVHRGHQHLLACTRDFAGENSAKPGAVVFDPHPKRYFNPGAVPFLLSTLETRRNLLRANGIDHVIMLAFNAALTALQPDCFVKNVLRDRLGLKGVVVGSDFRFARNREGDVSMLADLCSGEGMAVKIVDPLTDGRGVEKYASSTIRKALQAGEMQRAAALLGRTWSIAGTVVKGRKKGRQIGFPTANIIPGEVIGPRHGVYASTVRIDGKSYGAVSNFGCRPTLGGGAPLLEVHIFDFDRDIYGRYIDVALVRHIRDEHAFDSMTALETQISLDCKAALRILETAGTGQG